jgi:UDP-galactopyranose mutase
VLPDVLCFSHLRWNFVFQRPQHLLNRCARDHRVFFIEEPVYEEDGTEPRMSVLATDGGVHVAVPHLPGRYRGENSEVLRALLDRVIAEHRIHPDVLWYYTPMALRFSDHLAARAVVYDCMDELSGFAGAPAGLIDAERALLARAGVVFTGGRSLYEAKKHRHRNIHPVPSSVDVAHFARARAEDIPEPDDQVSIPRPRLGFFGVLDERFDGALVGAVARLRPDWHIVLIGPTVKIDPASLPHAPNIHYPGQKAYADLPAYLAGWDVAVLPFAKNDATRFISPTKTPEYLAGGKPVVSTSITDVVHPYGDLGLARIADTPEAFVAAVTASLAEDLGDRLRRADRFLATMSWDATWAAMAEHIRALGRKDPPACSITSSSEPASLERSWQNVSPPLQAKRS